MSFTPTPEAVEAVAKAIAPAYDWDSKHRKVHTAIAAFVEAEGLEPEEGVNPWAGAEDEPKLRYRLVGPWRKRYASPDATQ